jgi:hypothetical protein
MCCRTGESEGVRTFVETMAKHGPCQKTPQRKQEEKRYAPSPLAFRRKILTSDRRIKLYAYCSRRRNAKRDLAPFMIRELLPFLTESGCGYALPVGRL